MRYIGLIDIVVFMRLATLHGLCRRKTKWYGQNIYHSITIRYHGGKKPVSFRSNPRIFSRLPFDRLHEAGIFLLLSYYCNFLPFSRNLLQMGRTIAVSTTLMSYVKQKPVSWLNQTRLCACISHWTKDFNLDRKNNQSNRKVQLMRRNLLSMKKHRLGAKINKPTLSTTDHVWQKLRLISLTTPVQLIIHLLNCVVWVKNIQGIPELQKVDHHSLYPVTECSAIIQWVQQPDRLCCLWPSLKILR